MKKPKLYLRDFVYVPTDMIDRKALKKHLYINHFNDNGCKTFGENHRRCPEMDNRPTDVCKTCPNYGGLHRFYRKQRIGGENYVGIARGRRDIVREVIGPVDQYRIVDMRATTPMRHPITFTGTPRPHQNKAHRALLKHAGGLLVAPPRTGKTVIATRLICELGMKAMVITHQDDLLRQFRDTFIGGKHQQGMTDAGEVSEKSGRPSVVLAKTPKDYLALPDVLLTTYQMFIRPKGRKLLKRLAKIYGVIVVDEIHRGNANAYAKVLTELRPKHLYGFSATPDRKDGLEFVVDRIVGAPVHTSIIDSLNPRVTVHLSKSNAQVKVQRWDSILKALYFNNVRTQGIVELVMADLKRGHSIVIPVAGNRRAVDEYTDAINRAWMDHTGCTDMIAEAYYAYPKPAMKEAVLERAQSGERRVTVAMRSMLTGINVPRWSSLIEVAPINNAPNFTQESKRICTPMEGKKAPVLRFVVDLGCKASLRCFLSTLGHCKKLGYTMDPKSKPVLAKIRDAMGAVSGGGSDSYEEQSNHMPISIGVPGRSMRL